MNGARKSVLDQALECVSSDAARLDAARLAVTMGIDKDDPIWQLPALFLALGIASGPATEKALTAMSERLDRIEANAKAAPPKPDIVAGLRAAPNAQLDRIELHLQAQDARLGRIENPPRKPLVTHFGGVGIALACLAFGYFGRSLPPAAVFGSFGLLAYLYLAPALGPRLVTFAQRLRR